MAKQPQATSGSGILYQGLATRKNSSISTTTRKKHPRNYSKPFETDEGILVWQSDPSAPNDNGSTVQRNQLVWGSVLWPSGICLSKYLWYLFHNTTTTRSTPTTNNTTSKHTEASASAAANTTTILELGCGTGLVGLTAAKLGAKRVTLTDYATSDLKPILIKNALSNGLLFDTSTTSTSTTSTSTSEARSNLELLHLDWKDVDTFIDIHPTGKKYYDLIVVAADVLYGGGDALFARALAAHLPSVEELGGNPKSTTTPSSTMALVACPNRTDSPLANFVRICIKLGLSIERLETPNGEAAGASHGHDPIQAFGEARFRSIGSIDPAVGDPPATTSSTSTACREEITKDPKFASTNQDEIQLFRIQRVRGTALDARKIRRVSRL